MLLYTDIVWHMLSLYFRWTVLCFGFLIVSILHSWRYSERRWWWWWWLNKLKFGCVFSLKGRNGLAGSYTGRTFHKRSFVRPSWVDEDMVDSADTTESVFFSKVSRLPLTQLNCDWLSESCCLIRSTCTHTAALLSPPSSAVGFISAPLKLWNVKNADHFVHTFLCFFLFPPF